MMRLLSQSHLKFNTISLQLNSILQSLTPQVTIRENHCPVQNLLSITWNFKPFKTTLFSLQICQNLLPSGVHRSGTPKPGVVHSSMLLFLCPWGPMVWPSCKSQFSHPIAHCDTSSKDQLYGLESSVAHSNLTIVSVSFILTQCQFVILQCDLLKALHPSIIDHHQHWFPRDYPYLLSTTLIVYITFQLQYSFDWIKWNFSTPHPRILTSILKLIWTILASNLSPSASPLFVIWCTLSERINLHETFYLPPMPAICGLCLLSSFPGTNLPYT